MAEPVKPLSAKQAYRVRNVALEQEIDDALNAIANGQHYVGVRISEDECRAEYRRWVGAADTLYGERAWLASARAAGRIREG